MARPAGAVVEPVAAPGSGDRRFDAEAWRDNPIVQTVELAPTGRQLSGGQTGPTKVT
jgi:hypothetical protein